MSRPKRTFRKKFIVFCEGDTEYNYFDAIRSRQGTELSVKPIDMEGGGYKNFLKKIKTEGKDNCLAKFIIVDGDRVVKESGEKKNLQELIDYCCQQNKNGKTPHFLIVDCPDFEYVACLHFEKYKGQQPKAFIEKELGYKSLDDFKADKEVYRKLNQSEVVSTQLMCDKASKAQAFVRNTYKIKKSVFEIIVEDTKYDWDLIAKRGTNINELFDIIYNI